MSETTPQSRGFAASSTVTTTVAPPNLLSQRQGESDRAFASFIGYCEMGAGRTLRRLHERFVQQGASSQPARGQQELPPTTALDSLFKWSHQHRWQERVRFYDAQERSAVEAERARVRRERQDQVLAAEWERSQRLLKMGDEILVQSGQFLHNTRRVIEGKPDANGLQVNREIVTLRLKAEVALKAIEIGQRTARLACGLSLSPLRTRDDLDNMSDAQLYAYLVELSEEEEMRRNSASDEIYDPDTLD